MTNKTKDLEVCERECGTQDLRQSQSHIGLGCGLYER